MGTLRDQGINLTLWPMIHRHHYPRIIMEIVIKHQYVLNSHFRQVQYYSSVLGTHKRRRRLKAEWYFFWCLDHHVQKYIYKGTSGVCANGAKTQQSFKQMLRGSLANSARRGLCCPGGALQSLHLNESIKWCCFGFKINLNAQGPVGPI